jgi:hypothetical protein
MKTPPGLGGAFVLALQDRTDYSAALLVPPIN